MYEFGVHEIYQYVSDLQMLMTSYVNGEQAVILSDKILFELVMKHFVRVPRNFAFLDRGHFVSLDPVVKTLADVQELIIKEENLIAKPTCGVGGKGIILLSHEGNHFFLNGRISSWERILARLKTSGDLVICEYVRQGEFAQKLFPRTVNTIRMLSMREAKSGKSFIAAAAFRVGCSRSVPVDNISAGGIACDVDLESGYLGRAATGFFGHGRFQWIDKHPDTGLHLEGLAVPGWKHICSRIESVADKFPQLPYIAWDVAIGHDDILVIEGNAWSDVSIFQIFRPLLTDNRIRAFLKEHDIITG